MDLGPFGSLQAKAAITPHTSPNPDMEVSLDLRVRPRLQALLPLLPQDQLQGLALEASPNPESMIFRVTGLLQNDFQPRWATATAALKLSSIGTTWDKMGVGGNLDQLTLLLSSKYQQQEGAFRGTLGFSTKLSDLHAMETLNLEAMGLILKSSFKGNLSPTFEPLTIHSQDQLQLTFQRINFDDQSLTATLPSLKLALQTKEDLMNQDFILEQFRVMSEDILDLNMQGQFSQATQQFTINLESPLIHIGNLLTHLSGPVMEGMENVNPKGRLELTMQASGRLPEPMDLEQINDSNRTQKHLDPARSFGSHGRVSRARGKWDTGLWVCSQRLATDPTHHRLPYRPNRIARHTSPPGTYGHHPPTQHDST